VAEATIGSLRAELAHSDLKPTSDAELRAALESDMSANQSARQRGLAVLQQAREHYSRFEYGAALARVVEARQLLLDAAPNLLVRKALAQTFLLEGQVHMDEKRLERAADAFRAVRRLDSSLHELDPGSFPPEVVKLFEQAAQPPSGQPVNLEIRSKPAGAKIYINGRKVGAAPLTVQLSLGVHYVTARLRGYAASLQLIDVDRGGRKFELRLKPQTVADRIRTLRERLMGADPNDPAWEKNAGRIAELANAEVVILLRDARGGGFEAAVWRNSSEKLGAWMPVPSARFTAALLPDRAVPAGALVGGTEKKEERSWYATWWGAGLLAAGGAAIIGGVVYALVRKGDSGVSVGNWCVEPRC
jgi:hypothetical protein